MDAYDKISLRNRLLAMTGGVLSLAFAYVCLELAHLLWHIGANSSATLYAPAVGIFLASMVLLAIGVLAVCGAFAWRGVFTGKQASV